MLRIAVLLLVVANVVFYSWRQGWMDNAVGIKAQGDREPARLSLQVSPEAVRVLPPLPGTASAARDITVCLEIGPYAPSQLAEAQGALLTVLKTDAWTTLKTEVPPVWTVFMGPYPDRELRQRKIDELTRLKVNFEEVRNLPELGDGLALGRFEDRAAAEKAISDLGGRGVRSGRVTQLSPGSTAHVLRVEQVDPSLQDKLLSLQASGLQGRSFLTCRP